MKKTNINPVDLYCNALKGITLAANMLVLTQGKRILKTFKINT